MSAPAILADLAAAGVALYLADGGRLKFCAAPDAMTPERRALVQAHRADLIALLAAAPVSVPAPGAPSPREHLRQAAGVDGLAVTYGPMVAGGLLALVQAREAAPAHEAAAIERAYFDAWERAELARLETQQAPSDAAGVSGEAPSGQGPLPGILAQAEGIPQAGDVEQCPQDSQEGPSISPEVSQATHDSQGAFTGLVARSASEGGEATPPEPRALERGETQGGAGKAHDARAWPYPGCIPLSDPAKHYQAHGAKFPPALAAVLGPIARAWERTGAESQRREYSRLVAWYDSDPLAMTAARVGELTAWYQAGPVSAMADKLSGSIGTAWPADLPPLLAWLDALDVAELPESVTLRPGVTVTNAARFVALLRATVVQGPGSIRARRGLLADDLRDLQRALESGPLATLATIHGQGDVNLTPPDSNRRPDDTPAAHLARLGGWPGLERSKLDPERSHLLWDAARLWERDKDTERAARWAAQYWTMWDRVSGEDER